MPLNVFRALISTVERDESSASIASAWQGVYNRIENTSAMSLELDTDTGFAANAEVIIRNSDASTDTITITTGGTTNINVSPDLGLVIPVGGIGQLKRIGATDEWDFYGYIEA